MFTHIHRFWRLGCGNLWGAIVLSTTRDNNVGQICKDNHGITRETVNHQWRPFHSPLWGTMYKDTTRMEPFGGESKGLPETGRELREGLPVMHVMIISFNFAFVVFLCITLTRIFFKFHSRNPPKSYLARRKVQFNQVQSRALILKLCSKKVLQGFHV